MRVVRLKNSSLILPPWPPVGEHHKDRERPVRRLWRVAVSREVGRAVQSHSKVFAGHSESLIYYYLYLCLTGCRPNPRVNSGILRQFNFPFFSRDSCRYSTIRHWEQRPVEDIPPSYWRLEGKSPAIYSHRERCQCLWKG